MFVSAICPIIITCSLQSQYGNLSLTTEVQPFQNICIRDEIKACKTVSLSLKVKIGIKGHQQMAEFDLSHAGTMTTTMTMIYLISAVGNGLPSNRQSIRELTDYII